MNEVVSGAEPRFAAFVALDWADQKHVWSLQPADSEKRQQGEIPHTPEAVEAWVAMLSGRFGDQAIAVAVEQSRGALVFMLSKYKHCTYTPFTHALRLSSGRRCSRPERKTIPLTPSCYWICWCIIGTACGG